MLGIETLLLPVMSMMGLAFLYSFILRHVVRPRFCQVAFGMTFGAGIVFAMSVPIELAEGLIFDLRGLLVSVAVVFAGWVAGLIAVALGILYRLQLGGAGAMAGCATLVLGFVLGGLWRALDKHIRMHPVLKDACLGMVSSFTLLSLFLLPGDMAMAISAQIGPSMLVANVLGAVTLGFVLRREEEQIRIAEELRQVAEIDPLTNLLNRRGALRARGLLGDDIGRGQALLYFDIDYFKSINDLHGHVAGDAALAAVSGRIAGVVREPVVCSRHGGDEFTIFMRDVTEETGMAIANRLCRLVKSTPIAFDGREFRVSVSIGVYWTDEPESHDEMLLRADGALLQAKAMGRNRVTLASVPLAAQVKVPNWSNPSKALH